MIATGTGAAAGTAVDKLFAGKGLTADAARLRLRAGGAGFDGPGSAPHRGGAADILLLDVAVAPLDGAAPWAESLGCYRLEVLRTCGVAAPLVAWVLRDLADFPLAVRLDGGRVLRLLAVP